LAVAHWFWQEGVAKLGAAKAGIFLYLEPLSTTALAVPLLGEHFGFFTAAGGLLVLAGVFWAERRN
ncbi:MAG: EamA family transporter, partial [Chloroflexi bacterium]|nr:EamA family transporter [Chloroflexota bacterium]